MSVRARSKRTCLSSSTGKWPAPMAAAITTFLAAHGQGTAQQGYQSRFSPAQLYRAAIVAIERHVGSSFNGATFAKLGPEDHDKLLKGMESGEVQVGDGVDSRPSSRCCCRTPR